MRMGSRPGQGSVPIYRQITGKGRSSDPALSCDRLKFVTAIPTFEVGNALKADIERPGLKCREVPLTYMLDQKSGGNSVCRSNVDLSPISVP